MEISLTYALVGGFCLVYVILFGIAIRNRQNLNVGGLFGWLVCTLLLALLAQVIHILVPNAHLGPYGAAFIGGLTQPSVAVLLASLALVGFTGLSLRYLQRRALWIVLPGLAWWVASTVMAVQTAGKSILLGQPGWLLKAVIPPVDNLGVIVAVGWLVIGLVNLLATFVAFSTAHLPEIMNRALFWFMVIPLVILGALLGSSGGDVLKEIGWSIQLIGYTAAVYAAARHRVLDVRRVFRLTFASALTMAVTAVAVLIALLLAQALDNSSPNLMLLLVGLAIATALVYMPVRAVVIAVVNRLFGRKPEDTAMIVRQYSQNIAGVVELTELSDLATDTLRKMLRVRRGGLLLATRDDNETIRIEPMLSTLSEMPDIRAWIPKESALYHTLSEKRLPLLQYDIEYAREYAEIAPELRSFFKQLKMTAYAPIVIQGQLIGLLAAGAKVSDDPFSQEDLNLLATLATQNGVALRNARLVSDLRRAKDETQALNTDILKTKERLEQLDAVKTDFITIASHELRTPLAQIRGYTDILDALTDSGAVDVDQAIGITNNLRKATDRLERLIADMLDVSQLGLDAMDLRFATTTIDNVVRLAIEPLAESIKQRKLQLTVKGLKHNIPPIEADMQRLVQAFRNIVLNSIKYTPDGGRIDITARVQPNEQTKQDEIIISIQDTGIGIDPKFHELIFEKFFRIADPGLHSTGTTKFMGAGPGLGLTIARGVVQGHGGRIWVESPGFDAEKLPGTTVQVLLPVVPPATAKRVMPFEQTGTMKAAPAPSATPAPALAGQRK